MIAELGNDKGIVLDLVDDAMFIGDASRPVSGKSVFEGFRLADSLVGQALNVTNEGVDPDGDLFIGFLPIEIFIPGM